MKYQDREHLEMARVEMEWVNRQPVAWRYAKVDGNWASREYFSGRVYRYYQVPETWRELVGRIDSMAYYLDWPPAVRATIPRIRNGSILVDETCDDRARLLGIAAIAIAEAVNGRMTDLVRLNAQQRTMYVDDMFGIEPAPVNPDTIHVNYQGIEDLLEVMTMLMDYTLETALAMIAAKVDQQTENGYISTELSIFADYVDSIAS